MPYKNIMDHQIHFAYHPIINHGLYRSRHKSVCVCTVYYNNGMFFLQISPFWNFCLFCYQLFLHQQNKDNSAPCGLHEVTTLFLLWSNIFSPFECNYRQGSLRIQSFSYFLFRFLRMSGFKKPNKKCHLCCCYCL